MAPITRSSVHGTRALNDEENTASLEFEDDDMPSDQELIPSDIEEDMADDSDNDNVFEEPPLQSSTQELLRPLQETADRVGRQVEAFAQTLDKFNSKKKDLEGQELWKETWLLMDKYAEITKATAERVKQPSSAHTQAQKSRKISSDSSTQRQNLVLESNLWTLSAQLLPCKSPDMIQDTGYRQNSALAELHRYSNDTDLWSAFLDVDAVANQYETLLEWLQDWKRNTSEELKEPDLESYNETHRGNGTWTGGNAFTQGPIKRQKVARAHPGPLEPNPDLRDVHRRKADQEILVTQMDPDAPLRQDAVREIEDDAFETSAWHANWELLRRGSSVALCRQWWEERQDLWRSLVIRNASLSQDASLDNAWLRIISLASNQDYLRRCREICEQDIAETTYERAVYGIISGSYAAVAPVCKTLDDHLFALTNELLIERFEQFLEAFARKLQDPALMAYSPASSTMDQLSTYFESARVDKTTKSEAHQPHKYFQSMLMSDQLPSFLLEMGHAAAQMAHLTGQSQILFDKDTTSLNGCAQVAAQDPDLIRVAVHIQLALQPLGALDEVIQIDPAVMENNIINYIGLLERQAKYSLLPLYTSKLSPERQPRVLGRILAKVTEPKERDTQMRLMRQYQIPVYRVIYTICDYARRSWAMKLDPEKLAPAQIIEYKEKIVRVRAGFLGELKDEAEAHVVQAHEWVNYIDAQNWGMAVWLMTALYKTLLLTGKLAAAKALAARVDLSSTSLKVTGMNLSLAAIVQDGAEDDDDIDMNDDDNDDDATSDAMGRLASPTKRRKESKMSHPLAKETTNRTTLSQQSQVWAHLEHLVLALDALELWQDLADQVDTVPRQDVRAMKAAKKELSQALQTVHDAMQPLLQPEFLNMPNDEQEDLDLEQMRTHYLPECVLAYNSALYFGGHAITRHHLVQCMELAQQVAKNESLTQAFVSSKRMQELVTAFALDSQALLRANEHGSGRGRGRGGKRSLAGGDRGGRSDIWQVTWKTD